MIPGGILANLRRGFFVILILLLLPGPGWSWGRIGHRVSARLAEERLTPEALAAVHNLLGPDVTLTDISTWADEQRSIRGSGLWHYVNVPITESRYRAKYCPPGGCVVSKIEDFRQVLLDPRASKTKKQQALKFLVHFIQDLHCPMHVGDTGSRGGNLVQIRFLDRGSNMHRLWDSQLIEWHSRDEQQRGDSPPTQREPRRPA